MIRQGFHILNDGAAGPTGRSFLAWDETNHDPSNFPPKNAQDLFLAMDAILCIADGLERDPKFSREKMKQSLAVKDFDAWVQEGHDLAVQYVYLNGKLTCATTQPSDDLTTPMPALPKGYIDQAEQIALGRVVLAGYRTADLLNSIFDPR